MVRFRLPDGSTGSGCPWEACDPGALLLLSLYPHYEAGHLWARGGVAEQPAIYLEAMAVIARARHDAQEKPKKAEGVEDVHRLLERRRG